MRFSIILTVISVWAAWSVRPLAVLPAYGMEEKEKPAIVLTSRVQALSLFDELTYPARVIPQVNSTILSDSDGVVSKIYAPLGERVRKHQKILQITHTDPIYQFAPMVVLAPEAGVVSSVEVTEGSQVTKGQRLASVTDPSRIRFTLEVPALDISEIRAGLQGSFRIKGREGETAVRVRGISPFVDPASGTASAELELVPSARPSAPIAPGLIGEASFEVNRRRGYSISDQAVVYKGKDTFVRLLVDGKVKRVPVVLGARSRGRVEILKGLADNETLIERASRFVAEGESVVEQKSDGQKADGGSKL